MWVSKKKWGALEKWVHSIDRRIDDVSDRGHTRYLSLTSTDYSVNKELNDLRQRVKDLEAQVMPVTQNQLYWLSSTGPMVLTPSTKPVPLVQKVNLLLDHLKLRVQPEGTTPVALVKKTGGK